ncbi:mitochondrial outer membrane translocase complex, subunit Tom5 [Aspergillus avenaceus]|uniref:Mitochondrial outer membrane translocase complex, subunit Tom5 n=1 Tax=Aspergillus avenaceus TaxID=36643 RepID=A0A5N6U6V8_ASPAV|nr:mitochondrial outer membrane translocase complex, subunit Tom5 [Aspergillus avenaceus]
MFAPGQEMLSKEEIRAGEEQARQTIQTAITGGILLYLSPFAVDFVKKFL